MGATSIWHWVILLLIVVLLFGRGKISEVMGDVAKGIKSFKKGLAEDEAGDKAAGDVKKDPKSIESAAGQGTQTATDKTKVG